MTAKQLAQREVWIDAMLELAAIYPELVLLDGDLATSSFCQKFENAYPQRFLQMGIAEQNMAGVAAGLATLGFAPWTNSFAVFLANRMLDQIRVVIAQPNLNVKFAAQYSGILAGKTGKTHIAVEDIAVMRAMPHMTVIAPCDGVELKTAMYACMRHKGPLYLRITRSPAPVFFDESYRFEIGKAVLVREGRDLTIIGTGAQTLRALEAAQQLAGEGIEAHILHVPTIKPLDAQAIVAAADKTGLVLTTEEHSVIGGLGAAVAEVLGQQRPTLMRIHGLQDTYGESGPDDAMLEKYQITPRHVVAEAKQLLQQARGHA